MHEHSELNDAFDPPALPVEALAAIALDEFGIGGELTALRGEREQNVAIRRHDGDIFVLKLASISDASAIDFQSSALDHIAQVDPELPVPRVIRNRDGELHTTIESGNRTPVVARLLTYLTGHTFDDAGKVSAACLDGVGALQARLGAALAEFDHPAADAHMPWALDSGSLTDEQLWAELDPDARDLAEPCRKRVEDATRRMLDLPRQVIHSDAHRGNLLRADVRSEIVVGVIDFGDTVRSATMSDLGISGASFLGDQDDPVAGLIALTRGYHRVRRLDDAEAALVPELVLCRMVLSTLMTDYQRRYAPHIAADVDAERPGVLRSLQRWSAIQPHEAVDRLLDALAMTDHQD